MTDSMPGGDGTPAWAYDEDGYCVCCGNGRWRLHMPECELRDLLDQRIEPSAPAGTGEIVVGQVWAGKRWGRHLTVRAIRTEHDETLIDFTYGIDGLVLRTIPAAELLEHWRLER